MKAYSAGYAVQSKKTYGKGKLEIRKAGNFLIVLHQETMTLCNTLYIPCSIFESTMPANYGISRIPSAAKALIQPMSKYT